MSIYFDFEVGPSGRRFRRAVDQDVADIELFCKREETDLLFCHQNIGALIELSVLSLCLVDEDHNVTGFITLNDDLPLPGVDAGSWEVWIRNMFRVLNQSYHLVDEDHNVTGFIALNDDLPLPGVDAGSWEVWIRNMFRKYYLARNTLFIHFTCFKPEVADFFLEEAFVAIFLNDAYLHRIILVVPPQCKIDCLAKFPIFKRNMTLKQCSTHLPDDTEGCLYLHVAERDHFLPKLRVRRAVEEDNDEVVEILDNECSTLREMYGDFYISELLSRHPEMRRSIIVAETENHDGIVGVMSLNEDVNYKELQRTYELSPYCGLLKTDILEKEQIKRENELFKTFGERIILGQRSPFEKVEKDCVKYHEVKEKKSSKERQSSVKAPREVNFLQVPSIHRLDSAQKSPTESLTPELGRDLSLVMLMDDEPLDYEIVNIDSNLLAVPDVGSFESLRKVTHSTSSMQFGPKKKRRSQGKKLTNDVIYEGEPNAFTIELFGLTDAIDGRQAFDMLEAAFESMPKYEYCIIRVPNTSKSFPLLHHFCFVPTKPDVDCKYALYIAHRSSVLGIFRVRKITYSDTPEVCHFLNNINAKETVYTIEERITYREYMAYMILSGFKIVGIGILEHPQHMDMVRAKFMMDVHQRLNYHKSGQGQDSGVATIQTVLMYPVFEAHFGFFAREMMRMSGTNTLLWLTAYRNKIVAHKANAIISAMTPLPFRVTPESGLKPQLKRVYQSTKNLLSFSGWFISKKFTSIAKLNVTTRIVVVGASRTAIAFLNDLLFKDTSTYLTFTNVTLVSTHGLPYLRHTVPGVELMFPHCNKSSDRFLKSTPFTYYVNVVKATMVEIDKQEKCIITHKGQKVFYDKLFLLMGKQFQHPDYMKNLTELERAVKLGYVPPYVRMDDPKYRESLEDPATEYETPQNVFFINDVYDAHRALQYVKTLGWRFNDYKVCVYGACIEAYCCISALIHDEVPPEDIIFVEPFPFEDKTKSRVSIFCNLQVDATVADYLSTLKVQTHRGYYFNGWHCNDEPQFASGVEFTSQYHRLDVECAAFFYYGKKYINPHAFVAINKCGLAYDGGILIDHEFLTRDPHIYSAGPGTRYYRRYFTSHMSQNQKFYDSYEIGQMLAIQIKNQLDPLFLEKQSNDYGSIGFNENSSNAESLDETYKGQLPKLTSPKVKYCLLPGGLQYLDVRPPGCTNPHYYILAKHYAGSVFETFENGYFKLHLNNELIVDGITCLTPKHRNIEHFKLLYGLSAITLNNVHLRYLSNRITDFYEYFRAPWSFYIYYERSEELLTTIKHLKPKNDPHGKPLEEVLRDITKGLKDEESAINTRMTVHTCFENSHYYEAMTDYVISWLNDNELMLSVFITSSNVMEFSHDVISNRAFRRCKKTIKKMLEMVA